MECFLGLDLTRFTPLNNGRPHCFRRISNPFHQELRKAITKYPDQIGDMKPYLAILSKPARPLYEKLKLMYRYTIVEVETAFKNLHSHKLTNRTKEIIYRLLYNMTPISRRAKCAFCNEKQTEAHLYGICKVWKGARLELHMKIKEMTTIPEWDLLKIILINLFPNFGREIPKIIELAHKYRRLIWELTAQLPSKNGAQSGSKIGLSPSSPTNAD